MATVALLTAEDVLAMTDDGHRYEVIDGELIRMSPSAEEHSEIGLGFGSLLRGFVRPRRLGRAFGADMGYQLRDRPLTLVSPDASFVRTDRLPPDRDRSKFLRVPPDLAVEVVSPGDRRRKVADKVRRWQSYGVPLVVVVWPARRTVELHRMGQPVELLTDADEFAADDILAGFRFPIAELFDLP